MFVEEKVIAVPMARATRAGGSPLAGRTSKKCISVTELPRYIFFDAINHERREIVLFDVVGVEEVVSIS
jgi:hypothetical protein